MGKEIDLKLFESLGEWKRTNDIYKSICELCQGSVEVKIKNGRIVVTSPDCKSHRTRCLRSRVEEKLTLW